MRQYDAFYIKKEQQFAFLGTIGIFFVQVYDRILDEIHINKGTFGCLKRSDPGKSRRS